jgi:hypothetical protein
MTAAFVPEPRPAAGASAGDRWEEAPRLVLAPPDDPLLRVLEHASRLVLKYPVAAQAAFSALLAEGRRFAGTPEGRRWKAALAHSELMRRGRVLWEGSVLNTLEDRADAALPSAILDAVVRAASRDDLPALLRRLLHPEHGGDDGSGQAP